MSASFLLRTSACACLVLLVPGKSGLLAAPPCVPSACQVADQSAPPTLDPESRVAWYRQRVEQYPRHYTAWALLGDAYLQRARQLHQTGDLALAQQALDSSLAIQPCFEAYLTQAALANYRHRFTDGVHWGKLAAETMPNDTAVTALLVDAHLGLGQVEPARALLPDPEGPLPQDYHLAAALGAYLVAVDRPDQAVKAFLKAAELAVDQNAASHAAWARIRAAGVMLDAGRPADARPLLEAAATDSPPTAFLSIHRAELLESDDQAPAALALYESLLGQQDDPSLHARAARLARQLGQNEKASAHFETAERAWKAALEAGEIFPLEALASLYLDSPGHEQEALRLATRNVEFKRDRSARQILEAARKAAEGSAASASP